MADTEQLIVELGIKNNNVNKEISNINRELKNLDKEVKSTDKTTQKYGQTNDTLKSKLSNLEKMYTLNSKKLEDYKKKMETTTEAIKKQEDKIANMKLQGQDTAKAEEQLGRMKQTLSNVGHQAKLTENEMKGLEGAIKQTNTALKDTNISTYQKKLQDLGESCNSASETLKSTGNTANNAGNNILKATAPLVAIGVASGKMAKDFETSFAQVSTVLSDNTDLEKYKDSVIKASDDTGVAVNNFSEAVYSSISASVEQGKAVKFTNDSIKLAKGGFTSASNAVDVLTTAINGYGLQAEDATKISDQLITTQNLGKTTVDQLASSVGAIIPVASNSNFSFSELSASMALMTKNGIATSESATYLKSMLSELSKSGTVADKALREMAGKGFSDLKKEGKSTTEILGMLDEYAKKNGKTLKDMFGSIEAGTGALTLARNEGKDYNEILKAMENSAGATQKAFDKMNNTPAEKMAKSINKAKNEMIRLGENILPMMNEVGDVIGKVADWFGKMTIEQQQAIIKATLFTTVFGGTIKVLGSVTSGIGELVGGIGKASKVLSTLKTAKVAKDVEGLAVASKTAGVGFSGLSSVILPVGIALAAVGAGIYTYNQYQDALTKSSTSSREELGLLKTTLLELNGVHVKSQDELEKSGVKLKELGDDLGENFKNKVNESTKSMQDFSFYLSEINMDKTLTAEETQGFNDRVKDMFDKTINSIKEKQKSTQEEMSKTFLLDDNKIDENEQKVLDYLNKNYDTNIQEATKLRDEINKIYKGAVDDKRGLNDQEIKDIQDKMSKIKEIELQALADNQQEQMFAKNEFINRINTLDAEGAKNLLNQKKQQLDEQNAQTLASYDTQIETMKKASEKAQGADKENLEKEIAIKTDQRDKLLQKQKETWEGYIKIAEEKNPELKGIINKYNGEILSDADLVQQKQLKNLETHYQGLDKITSDGWNVVRNTTTGAMEVVYAKVDKTTGDITGLWSTTSGDIGGYTANISDDVKKMADEHSTNGIKIMDALKQVDGGYINTENQIVNSSGRIVGELQNVTTSADGVKTGILDLNGTPVKIETNADGTITKINGVTTAIEGMPREHSITFSFFASGLDAIAERLNAVNAGGGLDKITSAINRKDTGTNYYNENSPFSTVDERGWELASDNNVSMLGNYGINTLAYIPRGTGIRTHMQSVGDMKNEVSRQVNVKNNVMNKAFYELSKLQIENNKKQKEESEENKKRHKENKNYQKGILISDKFISKENIKEMHKIQNDIGGLRIDNKYYDNKALKLLEAKQYSDGHIVTKEEEKRMKNGLMIGQTFYDKETLEKMKVCVDGINGIWLQDKFISEANVKEMQKIQMKKLKSIKLDGEYYNKNSKKSKDLIENYKSKENKELDFTEFANEIGKQLGNTIKDVLRGLGIEVNVTNKLNGKEISNELTDVVIDKLGRKDRISRVAKGRRLNEL